MKKHEHGATSSPDSQAAHDELAKKAYAIYVKEGRPQATRPPTPATATT